MIVKMLLSLGLTILLEGCFALVWGVRGKDLYLLLLVNLLTNPVVVLVNSLTGAIWTLEIAAVVVEGILYKTMGEKIKQPFLFSICVNVFSYSCGYLISYFL